ncbi:MAG: adenine deaminase [Pseudomonadota bacterium]
MPLKSWPESAARLIAVAARREPADLVVRGGTWVNVHSGEVILGTDVAIADGRIAYCGPDAFSMIGSETDVIAAEGRYLVPGLCDAHMHVESSMLTVTEFVRAVMPRGTTSIFIDPHEIANVLGLPGVRLMHDEALVQPINVYVQMPSCAPSAPGLETTGVELGPEDVREAMTWPLIIGLGEMMNFPGVAAGDQKMLGEIIEAQRAGRIVGGHYASTDLGTPFHAYVAGGAEDDHEGTREIDAIARVRQGMRSMLRLGSAWYDVAAQVTAITRKGLDSRSFILCTDDCHSGTLVRDGHMDRVVRHAIDEGLEPIQAIQMATLNTATHFGLEREIGSITPGRRADILVCSDLDTLKIDLVLAQGQFVAEDGQVMIDPPEFQFPDSARNSVNMRRQLTATDFDIHTPLGTGQVTARVIGVVENQAPTRALQAELQVENGVVQMDAARDICQVGLIERHRATGGTTNGFVSGFGYTEKCALASTVAHDSHHMIVVGTSRNDMAEAANRLRDVGGGVSMWKDGEEIALIELPIAGLMTDEPAFRVAAQSDRLMEAMRRCGCEMNNAFMQHSLLALVVIPELRISDLGLIDVTKFEKTGLFV